MPSVAEVQFKATGSQQVVTAFNSVGSAAQTSSTKVQQNSTAMKSMGQGMKTTVSGIGQATTAFATLSLSIISTWRSYRDLTDAQIAVDRANLRVKKTTEAIRKTEAEVAKLKKEGAPATQKLKDAENKLTLQREQLGVQTDVAKEAQERFNDTQQNFYLSIIPTALSSLGLLTTAFRGLGGALRGGGGLVAGFGPIGLILTGISVAILAFKTNFLGLRDAVGGVIDWIKERFGLWKDTIEKVFNLIRSGNWEGAFALIKEAAAKFWEDLKNSVPLFGAVDSLIQKIRAGNWKGAFLQIWKAASDAWATIKTAIPIFGKIEDIIRDISQAKWGDAFQKIVDVAKEIFSNTLGKGIEFLFGKNWISGLDAWLKLQESEAGLKNRPLILQYAVTINGAIKEVTGIDIMKWFTDHPLTSKIPFFAGITMMVDDPAFRASVISGATIIVQKVGEGITAVAGLLDPYIASFLKTIFSVEAWTTAITESATTISQTGTAIITAIGGAISTAAADPNLTAGAMGDAAAGLWQGIQDWFTTNMPETTPVLQAIAQGFQDSIASTAKFFEGVGTSIWNALIEGIEVAVAPFDITGALRGALDKLIIKPKIDTTEIDKGTKDIQQKIEHTPATVTLKADTKPAAKSTDQFKNRVERQKYIAHIDANLAAANAKWNQFVKKVQMTTLQVKIAGTAVNIRKGSQAGAYGGPKQHGYQSTVHRPTMFMAGEGGRPEDVTVRPRGSVQRGGSAGGGGSTHITISFEPPEFAQFIRYRINDNQGVVK